MPIAEPTVIIASSALLGPELRKVEDVAIVVEGASIAAAGRRPEVEVPENARQIVATGTVIPGFIDAHVHIGFADPRDVLRGGVTTARDLGWPRREIYPMVARSKSFLEWPLLLAAGPMLTVEGGYPISAAWAPKGTGVVVDSPASARDEVLARREEGAVVVKIALNPQTGPVLPDDLLEAIVGAAHRAGMKVTGHIHDVANLRRALAAGVDEMAHMLLSGEELPDDVLDDMIERGIVVVPTLAVFTDEESAIAVRNLARFVGSGGAVIYGTDLGNAGPRPGIDPTEVTRMAAAGMSTSDVVRSATVAAASWLGLEHKGSIAPRMDADLVVLKRNLEDVTDLLAIQMVMREGRVAA